MKLSIFHIVKQSLLHYKVPLLYQFIIITFLSAIITGSLLTGSSVKNSLKKDTVERLSNTGIVISSGLRFFDHSLAERIEKKSGVKCIGIIEMKGFCRNFSTGETALNTYIFGIDNNFFTFNNNSAIELKPGEVAINEKLARQLSINIGDDIIIRFSRISDIPINAPFAPDEEPEESLVMTVGMILTPENSGNYSLHISQIKPKNIFINNNDLKDIFGGDIRANHLLFEYKPAITVNSIQNSLKDILEPRDIGLETRFLDLTNQYEFVSKRIFIDEELISEITGAIPDCFPVITYMANSLKSSDKETPYSFVSALPHGLYENIPSNNNIVVNRWLANDLNISLGDTIKMSYFISGTYNETDEESSFFILEQIVDQDGIWGDEKLMPEFPGISGRESCSSWDAGIPVFLDNIRQKDEDYWYNFKGTPKAFIAYEKGKEIWGNNFGPATALRFSQNLTKEDIYNRFKGSIDPTRTGFRIFNAREDGIESAKNSVDFSTLFLSLSFFIFLSCIVLLSLIITTFYNS